MVEARITDPQSIDRALITAILEQGRTPTIQFSTATYTPHILEDVNQICREFGSRIEVRFFGHHQGSFDGAVLAHLPDVRWLSVDCLTSIANEDEIGRLPHLTRLSFGVYGFDDPAFLERLDIGRLSHLSLSETAKRNLDLAPLQRACRLTDLFIQGHTKNIEVIADLPELGTLTLSGFPNKKGIAFLNELAALRSLKLLLGGRKEFDEFHHDQLGSLSIIRVRGLESIGSLSRFPQLHSLHIEDQLQLRSIDVAGASLKTLRLVNCKNLEHIDGLWTLDRLEELRAIKTKLNLDELAVREWPDSLDILALYSASEKWNVQARAMLDARGFREFSSR